MASSRGSGANAREFEDTVSLHVYMYAATQSLSVTSLTADGVTDQVAEENTEMA